LSPALQQRHVRGVKKLHSSCVTSALDGDEKSHHAPDSLFPGKNAGTHRKGRWVDPRTSQDDLERRKTSSNVFHDEQHIKAQFWGRDTWAVTSDAGVKERLPGYGTSQKTVSTLSFKLRRKT